MVLDIKTIDFKSSNEPTSVFLNIKGNFFGICENSVNNIISFLNNKEIIELLVLKMINRKHNIFNSIVINSSNWFNSIKNYSNHNKSIKEIIVYVSDFIDHITFLPFLETKKKRKYNEISTITLTNNCYLTTLEKKIIYQN